jgi:hypothetical protein
LNLLKRAIRAPFLRLEALFEALFGSRLNPIAQLGTLGWFLFWIVTASGICVYVFFDTGVTQAWDSLERLSRDRWWLGGIMRSLHRYASDALVIVVLLHAAREFAMDRMRGNRWFAWCNGIPLLWFLYACGITGYGWCGTSSRSTWPSRPRSGSTRSASSPSRSRATSSTAAD